MKKRTFLALALATVVCGGIAFDADAQGGGGGGGGFGGGRGGRGGFGGGLNQDQMTALREAATGAQTDLQPLRDKVTAAQKDVMTSVLAKADDATIKTKLEAVAKAQTDLAVLYYSKAGKTVAGTITDEQKTTITENPAGAYNTLFGVGGFGGGGGRGGRRNGGGGGGGGGGGN